MSGYGIYKQKTIIVDGHEVDVPDYESVIFDPVNGSVITNEQMIKITGPLDPLYYIIDITNDNYRYDVFKNGLSQPGYIVNLSKSKIDDNDVFIYTILKRGGWSGNRVKLTVRPDLDNSNAQIKATPSTVLKGVGDGQVFRLEYEQAPQQPSLYQWKKNGVSLIDEEDKISGSTTSELTLNNLVVEDTGLYSCQVTFNEQILNGEVVSGTRIKESNDCNVKIVVLDIVDDINEGETRYFGDTLRLSIANLDVLNGYRILGFQWYFNGNEIPGATSDSYYISRLITTTNGDYQCKVTLETGILGSDTYTADFTAPLVRVDASFMDMVAFYKLDGDATDATGTYNGTAYNTTFGNVGPTGGSAKFNRNRNSYINAGSVPLVNNKFSFGGWFNPTGFTGYQRVIGWFAGGPTLQIYGSGTSMILCHGSTTDINFNITPTANKWTHWIMTREDTTFKFYLDGVVKYTNTNFNINFSMNNYVRFNGSPDYTGEVLDMYLDDVGFWNRTLTEEEVADLYNYGVEGETYPFYKWIPDPNWHD